MAMSSSKVYGLRALKLLNDSTEFNLLKKEADEIILANTSETNSTRLSLRPSQFFSSLKEIALHLTIAGLERSFSIKRTGKCGLNNNQFKFQCQGSAEHLKAQFWGMCGYSWIVEEMQLGWVLVEVNNNHNHYFGVDGDEEESDSDEEVEEEEVATEVEAPVTVVKKVKRISEITIDHSEDESDLRLQFEKLDNTLRLKVKVLADSGPLQFPTLENKISFATHDEFRIYALASISQSNGKLRLNNTVYSNGKTFLLPCINGKDTLSTELNKEKCCYELKVVWKEKSKRWEAGNSPVHHVKWCSDSSTSKSRSINTTTTSKDSTPTSSRNSEASTSKLTHSNSKAISRRIRTLVLSETPSPEPEQKKRKLNRSKSDTFQYPLEHKEPKMESTSPFPEIIEPNRNYSKSNGSLSTSSSSTNLTSDSLLTPTRHRTSQLSVEMEDAKPRLNRGQRSTIGNDIFPDITSPTPVHLNNIIISSSSPSISADHLSIKQLAAFLHSLSPNLTPFAQLLHSYGLDSFTSLVDLVLRGGDSLENLMKDILDYGGDQSMRRFQRILFKSKIEEIREKLK